MIEDEFPEFMAVVRWDDPIEMEEIMVETGRHVGAIFFFRQEGVRSPQIAGMDCDGSVGASPLKQECGHTAS